jgi:Rrf2 family protein
MPERFLLQILRNLVTHGILQSTRGVEGGYALERSPGEISLLELIEAVDGPVSAQPPLTEGLSPESLARLTIALQEVTDSVRRQLENVKLSSLLSRREKSSEASQSGRRNADSYAAN